MRVWLTLSWLGLASCFAPPAAAHALSMQECFEGGDFIANAAFARENGMTQAAFVDRLVADIRVIQAFPPELRWFVADPEDAEFLHAETVRVFERPQRLEAHRAQFLSNCFDRMARLD
jgi:hypothetical protein